MATFRELGLSEPVLASIAEMGFEEPTPVQEQTIPKLLAGRDVVAQALTGTGKTAAFGIPLVERVHVDRLVPQAVVLTPTRELAIQVAEQINGIGHRRGLRLVPIYGGQPIDRQLRALHAGVHAVVATPGRLMDHMRRGTVDLSNVKMLVLDEADVMLDMGFQEDVEFVTSHLPAERVTALFSATMPDPILALSKSYMREPEVIKLSRPQALTVPEIDQAYYQVPFHRKLDALCRVLDVKRVDRTLVFCSTKRMVDQIVETLQGRGYRAEGLHGDMSQAAREKALRAFRTGQTEVLLATDVAARGLDIPDVNLVVNFDIPPDAEYYVHRIGRTGRLGRQGAAITFVNPWEMRELRVIEQITGARPRRESVPTVAEVAERETELLTKKLKESLADGRWSKYRELVEELLEEHDAVEVAAAALALVAAKSARPGVTAADQGKAAEPEVDTWEVQPARPAGHRPPFASGGRPHGDRPMRPAGPRPPFKPGAERGGERPAGARPPFAPEVRTREDRTARPQQGPRPPFKDGARRDEERPHRPAGPRTPSESGPQSGGDRSARPAGPRPPARADFRPRWDRDSRPTGPRGKPQGGHHRDRPDRRG